MKNIMIFSCMIVMVSSLQSMGQHHCKNIRITRVAEQMQACRNFCTSNVPHECVEMREYLKLYMNEEQCDTMCPLSLYAQVICSLAEKEREILIDCYMEAHNMTYNPVTQCKRFLDRINH